jgi:carboxyl-terminal processing protease
MKNISQNKFIYLIAGILIGFIIFNYVYKNKLSAESGKFQEILNITKDYYLEDVDKKKLFESAVNGMFEELDPHTTYLSADFQKQSEDDLRGDFDGIGIEFQILNDTINVVTAISGGPSDKLGIIPGDRIIEVNKKNVIKIKSEKVLKLLRGKKGTTVNLTVYRPSIKKTFNYNIVRDKIPIYSIDSFFMINDEVGYVSLSKFSETTTTELIKSLNELKNKGMKKLILDLRNNPGGLLSQAFQVADLFIDEDKLIVSTQGRKSEFNEEYRASFTSPYEKLPLILLINHGSASASEIVSGAIQDWDRGILVGQTSFGKGLVQRPFILDDGSAVRLTVARYFTPSGRAIQRNYRKSKEEYYLESLEDSTSEIAEKNKKEFKTSKGRIVYENGGITPDFKVRNEELSELYIELRRENVFYEFTRYAIDKKLVNLKNPLFKSLQSFKNNFTIDSKLSNDFINFILEKKINFNRKIYEKDKISIELRLKAHFARELFNNVGWYYILIDEDLYVKKALSLFPDYNKLLQSDIL